MRRTVKTLSAILLASTTVCCATTSINDALERKLESEKRYAAIAQHSNQGTELLQEKRYEEAVKLYELAVQQDTEITVVWLNKATAYRLWGEKLSAEDAPDARAKLEEAARCFAVTIEKARINARKEPQNAIDSYIASALTSNGRVQEFLGDNKAAADNYKEALQYRPPTGMKAYAERRLKALNPNWDLPDKLADNHVF